MGVKLKRFAHNLQCQLNHWRHYRSYKRLRNQKGDYSLEGFDRLKCIYIHNPKVAGVSINKALYGNLGGGHRMVGDYKQIFGPQLYRKYFSFSFVRNPYSRALSAYHFLKGGGMDKIDRAWAAYHLNDIDSFDAFIRKWLNEERMWKMIHFKPQYSYVCDIDTKPEVDFIGKFESIDEEFEKVCNRLAIQNTLSLNNKGNIDNSDWKPAYSNYSLDKISELYHLDFEIFGYDKI